jgi:mycothiol synthase
MIRPATPADAQTATRLVIEGDIAELGEADYSLGALLDEWGEEGFELAKDAVIAEHDGVATGYAHFRGADVLMTGKPPEALLEWALRRGSERGHEQLRTGVGHLAHERRALLEAGGWHKERSYWRMIRDVDPADAEPPGLRPLQPQDAPALYAISEPAFARNPDYAPSLEAAWIQRHFNAHDLDPQLSRVADRGFALVRRWEDGVAYLALLAVHPYAAGRGLGSTLLRGVFAAAARAGLRQVWLNVASDNPNAVRLYERVGMRQGWRVDDYQTALPN